MKDFIFFRQRVKDLRKSNVQSIFFWDQLLDVIFYKIIDSFFDVMWMIFTFTVRLINFSFTDFSHKV